METKKVNIDRPAVSSKEISDRQNFDQLMMVVKQPPNPFMKTVGFWGTIGSAVLAVFFLTKMIINNLNLQNNNAYDDNITLVDNSYLPQDTECIQPVFKGKDIPFETYEVSARDGADLLLSNGSSIHIPAGALEATDAPVEIKVRLFEDKASAFIAGIPMDFQGKAFESAGMIEIRGYQSGKLVRINPDLPIKVALKLHKNPADFGFYMLNEGTRNWEDYTRVIPHQDKVSADVSQEIVKAELEVLMDDISQVDEELIQVKPVTKQDFLLPTNPALQFVVDFNKRDFPKLAAYESVVFESLPHEKNFKYIDQYVWSDVALKQLSDQLYQVTFSNASKTLSVTARPVLTSKELIAAQQSYAKALENQLNKQAQLKQEKQELKRLFEIKQLELERMTKEHLARKEQAMNNIVNDASMERYTSSTLMQGAISFTTTQWGVFNSDRPISYPKPMEQPMDFLAQNRSVDDIKAAYVFDMKRDVRYSFGSYTHKLSDFALNNNESVIVIVYTDGDMAYGSVGGRNELEQKRFLNLTAIKAADVSLDLIKEVLNEDRITA